MQSGTVLNKRYQIIDLLAEGGMARVYRARDLVLDRTVAVKILREQFASDKAFLERFHQEARAAAGIAHPNIVGIYDVGADGGANYIVMELVEGSNLKQIIQQDGSMEPSRALDVAQQILAALAFAHQRGIVHRDIKPQNILLSGQGHVKVADFGIARAAAASQLTETGLVMGSVHYCAPEQAMGKGVTQASDVYSVGVVLYEMLTGHLPFDSDNALGVALKHVQEPPPPLRQFVPRLSPGLESIVLRSLAKDPGQRYATADAMLETLAAFRRLGEQATAAFAAVSPRPPASAVPTARPAAAVPVAPAPSRRPVRRRTTDWLVVAFAALILAMVAAWVPLASRLYDLYFRPSPHAAIAEEPTVTPTARPTNSPTPRPVVVPSLVGQTAAQAERDLEALGLKISVSQDYSDRFLPGFIVTQTVPAERTVSLGTTVGVVVSRGAQGIRVPNVLSMLLEEAKRRIEQLDLKVNLSEQWHDSVAKGRVISQYPPEDSTVVTGTVVSLLISRGREPPTPPAGPPPPTPTTDNRIHVPKVVGLSEGEARRAIDAAGLTNTYTNYQGLEDVTPANRQFFLSIPVGYVVSQVPTADSSVLPGTTVRIAVRKR